MPKCGFHKFVLGLQKETLAQIFLVNFAKFLKTPFVQNTSASLFCPQYCTISEKVHDVYYPSNFFRVIKYVLTLIRVQQFNDLETTDFITIILDNIFKVFVLHHLNLKRK